MLFFFCLFLFPNKAICKDCFDQKIPELPLTPESVAESNPEESQVSMSEDQEVFLDKSLMSNTHCSSLAAGCFISGNKP